MKKVVFLLAFVTMLTSCKKTEESKYKEAYSTWKSEINTVEAGHEQALSIVDGFQQKINGHKKRLKEFSTYIADATKKGIKGAELEKEILAKCNENFKKHAHFGVFLNNLSALQGVFENKPFTLSEVENAKVESFGSVKDAIAFWTAEADVINAGHNKALGIIGDLKNHIGNHQKEIAQFTTKIEELKGKADIANKANKTSELKVIEADLNRNYKLNKTKHKHFKGFLENLETVQKQFEK